MNPLLKVCGCLLAAVLMTTAGDRIRPVAAKVREPVWAGRFYPADAGRLRQLMGRLSEDATATPLVLPQKQALKALILPHAGYIYSGLTAAHAGRVLSAKQFAKVIVLAPDHRVGFQNAAVSDVSAYRTPLGRLSIHSDARRLLENKELFHWSPVSDSSEHALEVVLPFLQYYLEKFELLPVVLGAVDAGRIAAAIDPLIDSDTLLVVSSDLSHYLSYDQAVARDRKTIDLILDLDSKGMAGNENRACGWTGIRVALELARKHGWQPILLHYTNSGDTAGDRQRVVGYAAIAFFGGLPMTTHPQTSLSLTAAQGEKLLRIARYTLAKELGHPVKAATVEALESQLDDPIYHHRRGTFVTLKIDGRLRGCIGSLNASDPLAEGVRRNAVNAAFHDPRFTPLSAQELDHTQVEVSILTPPEPLEYRDGKDLIAKLRVNVDGVIIRKGHASATFLPQVWEQLPRPGEFLSHLCVKAGLPGDIWQTQKLDVKIYQVQYFEEE